MLYYAFRFCIPPYTDLRAEKPLTSASEPWRAADLFSFSRYLSLAKMFRSALAIALLARYVSSQATDAGLAQALQSAELSTCAGLLGSNDASTLRNSLLQNGGTAFCPTNAAFTAANITATTPVTNEVIDVLSYHVARGQFPATSISDEENNIVRTYLNDGVNLRAFRGPALGNR